MELNKEQKEAVKEFNKIVMNCRCNGTVLSKGYCIKCKNLFCEFMDKWGMGVMCNDIIVDNLQREVSLLTSEVKSLRFQLDNKIKEYEKLKNE